MSVLDAALQYANAGLRVHPCRPEDKRPLTRWGSEATTGGRTIESWWQRWPDALVAVCTGDAFYPERFLVVIDIDPRNGGEQDEDLCRHTLTSQTRSGGWHHWCWSYEPVGNRVNLVPGVDIRGEGGYVIAPPSPGWTFLNSAGIEPLPALVYDELRRPTRRPGRGFEPASTSQPVQEGGRNDYVARFAGWAIRNELAWTADELVELCVEHNRHVCVPPLPDVEVMRTAMSIWRRDQRG